MGNQLTIVNETKRSILCKARMTGSKQSDGKYEWLHCCILSVNSQEVFKIERNKIYILSIEESMEFVVSQSETLFVRDTFGKGVTVAVKIRESNHYNNDFRSKVAMLISENEFPSYVESMKDSHETISLIQNLVLEPRSDGITASKGRLVELGEELMKKISNWKSNASIWKDMELFDRVTLGEIQNQLIGISRAITLGYSFFSNLKFLEISDSIKFLHKQISRITNTDILPCLEQIKAEKSLELYMFCLGLIYYIFTMIENLTQSKCRYKVDEYMNHFLDHFQSMWEELIKGFEDDCKITIESGMICKANFFYNGRLIYSVKDFFRVTAVVQIEDIKRAFLANKRQTLTHLFCDPLEFIKNVKGRFDVGENEYVYM